MSNKLLIGGLAILAIYAYTNKTADTPPPPSTHDNPDVIDAPVDQNPSDGGAALEGVRRRLHYRSARTMGVMGI